MQLSIRIPVTCPPCAALSLRCPWWSATISRMSSTAQEEAAPDEVVIPAKRWPWSRAWNELVHRSVLFEAVDKWWYERTYFSSSVPSLVMNGGVLALQATLHPLPSFVAVALASSLGFANEGHTLYLGLRHHDRSWFGQPQTWQRRRDGAMVRGAVYEDRDMLIREKLRQYPPVRRSARTLVLWLDEFWHNTNRIPAYILGGGGAPMSLILGGICGVKGLTCALISNGLLALTTAPEVRLGWVAAKFVKNYPKPFRQWIRSTGDRQKIVEGIAKIFDSQTLDDREHLKHILGGEDVVVPGSPVLHPVAPAATQPSAHLRVIRVDPKNLTRREEMRAPSQTAPASSEPGRGGPELV